MSGWAAVAQAVGSAAGAAGSAAMTEAAVKRQIKWERERAQNAHQWEVTDLKAAGLNPVISAGGNGATTGGISAPVPDTSGISGAISSAMEAMKTNAETAKTGAEVSNINADTKNKNEQNAFIKAQTEVQRGLVGLNSAKETREKLENINRKVKADNAELDFWNNQINTAARTAAYLAGTAGIGVKAIKGLIGEKGKPYLKDIGDRNPMNINHDW